MKTTYTMSTKIMLFVSLMGGNTDIAARYLVKNEGDLLEAMIDFNGDFNAHVDVREEEYAC